MSGIHYNGTVNVTQSGRVCQGWDSNTPHFHPITSLYRPYLEGHNYCRNPEGHCNHPWCYTMDPNVRWEYCNVSLCEHMESDDESNSVLIAVAVVVPILLVTLLTLIVIVFMLWTFIKRREHAKFLYTLDKLPNDNVTEESICNSNYVSVPTVMGVDQLPIIPKENITCISELGQGNFGMVMKGEAKNVVSDESPTLVAIKFLKEGSVTW